MLYPIIDMDFVKNNEKLSYDIIYDF